MNDFQLIGLSAKLFEPLFEMSDAQLAARGIQRQIADAHPGYPCRVGLEDAAPGEELLLLTFMHQPATSPYRASGPIFVRRGARQRRLAPGELPAYVTSRLISLRAYDAQHLMIDAAVSEGAGLRAEIERLLLDPRAAYLHLHNARRGCFSCEVRRA